MPEVQQPLDALEIVAYADVLDSRSVPHAVAPVFRFKSNPKRFLFPPFRFAGGDVVGGVLGGPGDFRSAVGDKVTLIDPPIPAHSAHELWIDEDMQPHYEHWDLAEEKLRSIAETAIDKAWIELQAGRFENADKHCSTALAAYDRLLKPLIFKAVIFIRMNQPGRVRIMKLAAKPICKDQGIDFDDLLETYMKKLAPLACEPAQEPAHSKIKGIIFGGRERKEAA